MVARAPIAAALGLGPIFYLDVEDDSPQEIGPYVRAAELARAEGLLPPDLTGAATVREALRRCGARLLIGGPEQLAGVADGSLDLISSTAVLEHVRRDAVAPLLAALRRVMAPDGLQLHAIDLHDHLGGGRVHLRFSARFWEGRAIARSGIYTNRIGATAWLDAFRAAGLAPDIALALVWTEARGKAHPDTGQRAQDARFAAIHVEARGRR
jgi:SAM-dependent methyltransferase